MHDANVGRGVGGVMGFKLNAKGDSTAKGRYGHQKEAIIRGWMIQVDG